jgi:acetylglutamate kinase
MSKRGQAIHRKENQMAKEIVTIKIGGKMATNEALLSEFVRELAALKKSYDFIVIHGGGKEVSELSEKLLGNAPVFINGVRMTSAAEMDIVEMVLSGKVNKRLVRLFESNGLSAIGISGADGKTFLGESISPRSGSRTGVVSLINTSFISLILTDGYVPIVSSTTMDASGQGININADEVALALSVALKSSALLYLSDIPGVLKENAVMRRLTIAGARAEISSGVISSGMIPKVESSIGALKNGVKKIIIGEYAKQGALERLLNEREGTALVP